MEPIAHDHDFSVTTRPITGGVLAIAMRGQADLHTAPELRAAIGTAIDDGNHRLVIDLTEATFLDSMTLGVLLGALKRLSAVAGSLVVLCPDPHLRRIFEITSLDRVLTLARTADEAVALTTAESAA